jgi:hypothetical protein
MSYVYSLNNAATLAKLIGKRGDQYSQVAAVINATLNDHWNGQYLFESTNREQDGAVIHAVTTFGKNIYGPTSSMTASTINFYNKVFCA